MSSVSQQLRRNRLALDVQLRDSGRREYFSPVERSLHRGLVPVIERHAVGRLLDAGCGVMPFRRYYSKHVEEWVSLDVERHVSDVDVIGDIQDMHMFDSRSFDTVLVSEVLEHVKDPRSALAEVWRVLRPGGKLVLTVPFLSRLHDEPNDFFRYTKYGLSALLTDTGYASIEIYPVGGLFSFLGHQISTIVVVGLWRVPILRHVAFWLSAVLVTVPCAGIDRAINTRDKLPTNYIAVATRTSP